MIKLEDYQKIVFAFADTAGGQICLSQGLILERTVGSHCTYFSNQSQANINSFSTSVRLKTEIEGEDLSGADLLYTGTSHPKSGLGFELHAILLAKSVGIPTVSFVDHWTSFSLRFKLKDRLVLPDQILVLDEHARTLAAQDGIPSEKLRIAANPYHAYIKGYWRPAKSRDELIRELDLDPSRPIVLIAPDPVTLRSNDVHMGFSEVDAVDDLIACFHQQIRDIQIIVKLHPLQPNGDFDRLEERWNSVVKIRWVLQADALELASISDIVAGFYSNLLLSAAALGKSILRYFPGPAKNDPLRHLQSMPRVSKQQLPILPLRELMARYE